VPLETAASVAAADLHTKCLNSLFLGASVVVRRAASAHALTHPCPSGGSQPPPPPPHILWVFPSLPSSQAVAALTPLAAGRHAASCDAGGHVHVWSTSTGERLVRLIRHTLRTVASHPPTRCHR